MKALLSLILAVILAVPAFAQAAPVIVNPGQQVTMTASAQGTTPFTFQWQKNGVNIPAATANPYVISSFTNGDVGTYTVIITNGAGNTTAQAVLSLTIAPTAGAITTTVK